MDEVPDELRASDPALSFDLLSASIRADARDLGTFLEALAAKLGEALPTNTSIERAGGLFARDHPVRELAVTLGERSFQLERSRAGVRALVAHQVRGVTLRREEMDLERWIEDLSRELSTLARSSSQAQQALARLLT
ncbi:MAG: hypothetical protein ACREPA_02930 [Candidatus Dormibacteraceae bacterium]